jgi:hypothetical protein
MHNLASYSAQSHLSQSVVWPWHWMHGQILFHKRIANTWFSILQQYYISIPIVVGYTYVLQAKRDKEQFDNTMIKLEVIVHLNIGLNWFPVAPNILQLEVPIELCVHCNNVLFTQWVLGQFPTTSYYFDQWKIHAISPNTITQ